MKYATAGLISRLRDKAPGTRAVTRTTDVRINLTQAETPDCGRLAIDNELVRMKYCV